MDVNEIEASLHWIYRFYDVTAVHWKGHETSIFPATIYLTVVLKNAIKMNGNAGRKSGGMDGAREKIIRFYILKYTVVNI